MAHVDPVVGLLVLEVVEAKDLPKMDTFGKADPYAIIHFGTYHKFKTATIQNTYTPVWNETFKMLVHQSESQYSIEVRLFDWDRNSKNDRIGHAEIPVQTFFGKTAPHDVWLVIKDKLEAKKVGEVHLRGHIKTVKQVEFNFWIELAKEFDYDGNKLLSFTEMQALISSVNPQADPKDVAELGHHCGIDVADISFQKFGELMATDAENLKKNPLVAKILPPNALEFIWNASAAFESVGQQMLENGFYGKVESKVSIERTKIMVHDRQTAKLVEEKIPEYIWLSLNMMYQNPSARVAVNSKRIQSVLKHMSETQGRRFNNPTSKREIAKFIEYHHLNTEEILDPLDSFKNFNEFFYRKLKPAFRKIYDNNNPLHATSAADSRLHVFETIDSATKIWIKGKNFSLNHLLRDEKIAAQYEGGSIAIFRLAPQDYHRFHSPVEGEIVDIVELTGTYYTVNPVAVRSETDVFTENKRCRVHIKSPQFGDVMYITVGATMVGSIIFTVKKGQKIKKGDEIGYFAFGGSTVINIFKPNSIIFDEDLIINSQKPVETLVKMGESLGKSAAK